MKTISTCFALFFVISSALKGQSRSDHWSEVQINSSGVSKNSIQVTPEGWSDDHFISNNDSLVYRINFQNPGINTSVDVVIRDRIDYDIFDMSTLRVLSSSHSFTFWIESSYILHWDLLQINLPDSIVNEQSSHGFVEFSIKTKPGLPTGTIVSNSAQVKFDSNTPISAGDVFNTICETGYPAVMISTQSDFCQGNTAEFVAHGTVGGDAPQFSWYVNNVLTTYGDTVLLSGLQNSDVVECVLTSSYLCALPSSVISNRIVSRFLNQPVVSENGGKLFSSLGVSYQWYLDGQPIIGATRQSFFPTINGNYQVQIFDSNGCSSTSEAYQYLNIGVDEISSGMKVYPNPASDFITFNGTYKNSVINIKDISGKTIKSFALKNNSGENYRLNISDILPGIYFMNSDKGETYNTKFVVVR